MTGQVTKGTKVITNALVIFNYYYFNEINTVFFLLLFAQAHVLITMVRSSGEKNRFVKLKSS